MILDLRTIVATPLKAIASGPNIAAIGGGLSVVPVNATTKISVDGATSAAIAIVPRPSPAYAVTTKSVAISPSGGVLVIDVSKGNTFVVRLDQNVTSLSFVGWPAGRSERIEVYYEQDATGGRTLAHSGVKFSGIAPLLSAAPNAIDRFVYASPDAINVFGDQVGAAYA